MIWFHLAWKQKYVLTVSIFRSALSAGFLMRLEIRCKNNLGTKSASLISQDLNQTWNHTNDLLRFTYCVNRAHHLVTKSWKSGVKTPWGSLGGGWRITHRKSLYLHPYVINNSIRSHIHSVLKSLGAGISAKSLWIYI